MFGLLHNFASSSGPVVHIAPLQVFTIHGIAITNSMLYGWVCLIAMAIILIVVARRLTVKPKGGLIQYIEVGVDFITNLVESAFDNPETGKRYSPYFVTVFFFILLSNWLGLLPIVGEGFLSHNAPLFRPFTGDLSGTLAMGVITMLLVYISSVRESGGIVHYLRHFFVGNPLNPLYFIIGILEMITDLARVISLSLRLFLNIAIGEILIAVFSYLGHFAAPLTALPFTLLEVAVAALQAYIFIILAVNYLAIAVNSAHAHDDDLTKSEVPETIQGTHAGAESG